MPSGPVPDQHDVVMRVDQAGNHGLSLQVDAPDASRHGDVVAHSGEAAVLDQRLRDHAIGRVHRMDLAVHQDQVLMRAAAVRSSFAPLSPLKASAPAPPRNCLRPSPPAASFLSRLPCFASHISYCQSSRISLWLSGPNRSYLPRSHCRHWPSSPASASASLSLPGVTITLAQSVPAGSFTPPAARAAVNVPAFCRVAGTVTPEVHFELWMPSAWNRKLLTAGNGGLAGTINYTAMLDPLRRGYAASSTDTGHVADNDAHWAQGHMQRVIDFAHRAVHVTTQADKAIIELSIAPRRNIPISAAAPKEAWKRSTEAQRYPRDYDGIIAGRSRQLLDAPLCGRAFVDRAGHADRSGQLHSHPRSCR